MFFGIMPHRYILAPVSQQQHGTSSSSLPVLVLVEDDVPGGDPGISGVNVDEVAGVVVELVSELVEDVVVGVVVTTVVVLSRPS